MIMEYFVIKSIHFHMIFFHLWKKVLEVKWFQKGNMVANVEKTNQMLLFF
jgi:hypothetical protein